MSKGNGLQGIRYQFQCVPNRPETKLVNNSTTPATVTTVNRNTSTICPARFIRPFN